MKKTDNYSESNGSLGSALGINMNAVGGVRHQNVDLLETIAIFFVVLYHGNLSNCDFVHSPSILTYISFLLQSVLSTCCPLFFFCSGYVLLNRSLDMKKHIFKTLRLILIAIVWAMVTIFILMYTDHHKLTPVEFYKIFINKTESWIGYYWFIGALVCIYITFPLIKTAFDTSKSAIFYMVLVCYFVPLANMVINRFNSSIVHDFGGIFFDMFNPLKGANAYSYQYFMLGGLLGFYKDEILDLFEEKRIPVFTTGAAMVIIFASILGAYGIFKSLKAHNVWDMVFNSYDSLLTLGMVLGFFLISTCYNPSDHPAVENAVRTISSNTLSVYILHEIILHAIKSNITISPVFCNPIGTILLAAAIIAVSTLFGWACKHIPFIDKLF